MKRLVACALVLTFLVLSIASCESSRAGQGAGIGAVIGGIFGAAVAVATGHKDEAWKYAAGGAAAGAAIGYAIGRAQDKKLADRDAAVQSTGYTSDQGFRLGIQSVVAVPNQVPPGQTAQVKYTWTAISPDQSETISTSADFAFKSNDGTVLATSSANLDPLTNGGGTVETTVDLPIPQNCPVGSYSFDVTLHDSQRRAQQTSSVPVFVAVA